MAQQDRRSIRLIKFPSWNLRRRPGHKMSRRRKCALALLFVLGAMIGAFLYLSSSKNVQASAKRYLERLVNGEVEVHEASFSLGQGIKLKGIRILTKGEGSAGGLVFKAENVNLKLNWLALLQGRMAATEIVAFRPEVFLVEESDGAWNFEPLFVKRDFKLILPLPKIALREGQVHYYEDVGGKLILGGTFKLNASFETMGSGDNNYFGQVETSVAGETVARLKGQFDTASGTFSEIAAKISLSDAVRQSLPRQVRAWMNKYNISGQLSVSGHYGPQTPTRITAELEGISCDVPINEQNSITISNARGQLQFSDEGILLGRQESGELNKKEPVRFETMGAEWAVDGQIMSYQQEADFDLNVSTEQFLLPRDPGLIKSLPKALRVILEDWDASGLISIESNAKRIAKINPKIQTSGKIECIDAAGTFRHFPYPIKNIRGLIRFDPQETFLEDFRAIHQSSKDPSKIAKFSGSGKVLAPYEDARAVFNLTVTELLLDDELRTALLDKDKAKWDMFNPSGTADVRCRVVHERGDGQKWTAFIEAQLRGASFTAKEFPYPLGELHGRVYIGPDKVEIGRGVSEGLKINASELGEGEFVSGRGGKGKVQLRGLVSNLGGPDELMNLEVKAAGLEFDEVLAQALPREARKLYEVLNPSGSGDVWGKVIRSRAKIEEPDFLINVWPRDAKCQHKDFPYPLEQVKGHVRLSPGKFELLDFEARQGPASFTGSGVVTTKDNEHFEASVTIEGQDVQLDTLVYENLKPKQKQLWDQLQPIGKCNIKLEIINDPQGQLTHRLEVEPRGVQITYKSFPYALGNLTGKLSIVEEQVDVDIWGSDPKIKITGNIRQHKNEQLVKLAGLANDVALDEKLKIVLPEKMRALWEVFEPTGSVDVRIDSLDHVQHDSGAGLLAMEGALVLKELNLNKPLVCQNLSGTVNASIQSGPGGLQVSMLGELKLSQLQAGPLRVKKLSGMLTKESKDSDQWGIRNIRAQMAGGQVVGHIIGNKGSEGKYEALLQVENVDLATLMSEVRTAKPKTSEDKKDAPRVEGRLKGSVRLEGNFNEPGSTGGRGEIFIDRAKLYELPLLMRIMRTLSLRPSKANAFETAKVDFYLQGHNIVFTEIILEGPSLRMGGMGVYDRKKDWLTVVLKRDPPKNIWSALPAFPEAIVAEISGPLADAKVEAKPFRDVAEELNKLFRKRKKKR